VSNATEYPTSVLGSLGHPRTVIGSGQQLPLWNVAASPGYVLKIAVFAPRAASCREKEGGGLRKRQTRWWGHHDEE
jgi:hypothetical protein